PKPTPFPYTTLFRSKRRLESGCSSASLKRCLPSPWRWVRSCTQPRPAMRRRWPSASKSATRVAVSMSRSWVRPSERTWDRARSVWSSLAGDLLKIPGVGHATAAKLQRLGISTIADLLRHRPRRYLDRSAVSPAAHVKDGQWATVIGVVERAESRTSRRSGLRVLEAVLRDESGRIGLVWFY